MKGIAVAGTLVADHIKMIDGYPGKGMLADISRTDRGIGGCVSNTAAGVKILDPSIPVKSIGLAGDDDNGRFLKASLDKLGIDTGGIRMTPDAVTSYSDVMTVEGTGERTFFHDRGACRLFGKEHMDLDMLEKDTSLLLLGYGGLLDSLNEPHEKYGTKLAELLHDIRQRGILTAMDVASTRDEKEMQRLVIPALPYVDYLIVNETEGGMIAGIPARKPDGTLDRKALPDICRRLKELGTVHWAVVHAPETGCAVDENGTYVEIPSLKLPAGYIVGAVGAGDAFCAGILYAIYKGLPVEEALKIGAATAAANLSAGDSTGGLRSIEEVRKLYERYSV